MGDHIMEGPGNCVELSYNIYIDGSPRWWYIDIVSILTYYLSVGCYGVFMRTSGMGYVHLKKQEWIYAKLAS